MESEQTQLSFNPTDKPIYAEDVAVMARIRVIQNNKKEVVEKEGHIGIVFLDTIKKQSVGEFVITKNTAKTLSSLLAQTVEKLEKELTSKQLPKGPEIKTTHEGGISYTR